MRKVYLFLCLVVIATISACTNFAEEEVPIGLSLHTNNTTLSESTATFLVTVRSGSIWSIGEIPSWIETHSIARSFSSIYEWNIVFAAQANTGFNREGTISFSSGTQTETITVSQIGSRGAYVPVESISLSTNELTLGRGESYELIYTILPKDASNQTIDWNFSDPSVANVSNSGLAHDGVILIDAIAAGTTTISVTTNDGGKQASCRITVIIHAESVSLSENAITLTEGEMYKLTATVFPSDAADKSITWSSSNTSVATVSDSGWITAKAVGSATISAKANDGGKAATCQVTVKSKAIPVTGISLDKSSMSLAIGDSEYLNATITPSDATDKSVSWTSSNTAIATVSSSGHVTAKAVGNAIITATTTDGSKKATCSVTVSSVAVTGVSLNKSSLSLYENDSETLIATFTPSNATNKAVTWSSSNSAVATVDSNGQVLAKAAGNAVITVTSEDGQKTANCSVSVKSDPYGAVDLGLSVKWASFNYGASSVTSTGGYYLWGDPTGNGEPLFFTPPSVNSVSGTQYDIVRTNWGGNWRIPTRAEINELHSNCTWTTTTLNGVSVIKVTGRNGASIYLPFTGFAMPDDGPIGTITISDSNKVYMMSAESSGESYGRFVYVFGFSSSGGKSSVSYNASLVKFPIRPVR